MDQNKKRLEPGAKIGIFGSGQLGRMLAIAAAPLGLKTHIYANEPGPACDVASHTTIGPYEDLGRVREFAGSVDVVTFEFENIPLGAAAAACAAAPVRPNPKALQVSQDRFLEKQFINELALPVSKFAKVDSADDLMVAVNDIGTPAILKSCRYGYDGKGQIRIPDAPSNAGESKRIVDEIGRTPAVLEQFVDFEYEVSVLLVRSQAGDCQTYDIPINTHRDGILDTSVVPSPLPKRSCDRALEIARTLANELDYVGVLAVEMFYLGEGASEPLIINEFAPRVHNSGHWTIDACQTSQFENHIRAVAGWPLGPTSRHTDAQMTNLIGSDVNAWEQMATDQNTSLHLYGKAEARPGRKMGHVTKLVPKSA